MKVQPFYIHRWDFFSLGNVLVPSLTLPCQPFRKPHQLLLDYGFYINLTWIIQVISWCNLVSFKTHHFLFFSSTDFFLTNLNERIILYGLDGGNINCNVRTISLTIVRLVISQFLAPVTLPPPHTSNRTGKVIPSATPFLIRFWFQKLAPVASSISYSGPKVINFS